MAKKQDPNKEVAPRSTTAPGLSAAKIRFDRAVRNLRSIENENISQRSDRTSSLSQSRIDTAQKRVDRARGVLQRQKGEQRRRNKD